MPSWVSHSIVADKVLERIPHLCPFEFHIGNIAPDCNVPTDDMFDWEPPRKVMHWMSGDYKQLSDAERFLDNYVKTKKSLSNKEVSFFLGYYTHLITDAEYRNLTHSPSRLARMWHRIKTCEGLRERAIGLLGGWEEIDLLFPKRERMKDIYAIERKYLLKHRDCGYIKYIFSNKDFHPHSFPNYLDYLPDHAIWLKISMMADIPLEMKREFPYMAISEEEYNYYLEVAAKKAAEGIQRYFNSMSAR